MTSRVAIRLTVQEADRLLAKLARSDAAMFFDMQELDGMPGDPPLSLAEFLRINSEENGCTPPDPSEVAELRACPVGGKVNLGIGGGYVTVTRVS